MITDNNPIPVSLVKHRVTEILRFAPCHATICAQINGVLEKNHAKINTHWLCLQVESLNNGMKTFHWPIFQWQYFNDQLITSCSITLKHTRSQTVTKVQHKFSSDYKLWRRNTQGTQKLYDKVKKHAMQSNTTYEKKFDKKRKSLSFARRKQVLQFAALCISTKTEETVSGHQMDWQFCRTKVLSDWSYKLWKQNTNKPNFFIVSKIASTLRPKR